jgi:hypothetical protein
MADIEVLTNVEGLDEQEGVLTKARSGPLADSSGRLRWRPLKSSWRAPKITPRTKRVISPGT